MVISSDELKDLSALLLLSQENTRVMRDADVYEEDIVYFLEQLKAASLFLLKVSLDDINKLYSLVWTIGVKGIILNGTGVTEARLEELDSTILSIQTQATK